jgi:hypothetical protein
MSGKLARALTLSCTLTVASPGRADPVPPVLETLEGETDDILGITWYKDASQTEALGTYVRLYFGTKGGRVLPLRLKVQYEGDDWLFTKDLLFKIDGRLLRLSPNWHAWERENGGGAVWETVDLLASPALASALARADSIKVRFSGKHDYDYELTDEEVVALRRVYWVCRAARDPADKRARAVVRSFLDARKAERDKAVAEHDKAVAEHDEEVAEHDKAARLQNEIDQMLGTDPADPYDHDKPAVKLVTLTPSDIVTAMRGVQPKVQACANQFMSPGTAMANISVASGGRVSSATVTGKFAGTPTGSCVEAAAKSAKFPPCQAKNFPWPITLSPR